MTKLDICSIMQIDKFIYKVPSNKDNKKVYEVNIIIGWCSCYSGQQGGFCKHQAYLQKKF